MNTLQEQVVQLMASFALGPDSIHGPRHWDRVLRNAERLAEATPGADPLVAKLFAMLHDTRRLDECDDLDHGQRAAKACQKLPMPRAQRDALCYACQFHTDGLTSDDPTVGVCWDADRLDLTRVGIRPDPKLMSTAAGRIFAAGTSGTWYHVTPDDHGKTMHAAMRPPLKRCSYESDEPRCCVCPTLSGCFAALMPFSGRAYVYKYEGLALDPLNVWDAPITGERWLVPPVALTLDSVIPAATVARIYAPAVARNAQHEPMVFVAQRLFAARVLGEAEGALSTLIPGGPADFIRSYTNPRQRRSVCTTG